MPSEEESSKAKPEISMRHSKLTAAEAAILSGELSKPSWQSKNEGIHERVSFEDSIWGFDLAGGAFYKTPLRVTYVKPDSRAEKAGIRAGDRLKRINDIDTSTLTIQEAHEIIIESGVYLRLAVTAPEDLEDSYGCWEDQIEEGYDSEEERRKEKEKIAKRIVHAKVSSYWSLQWPWVSKRRVIYRESNCFMVPSKFEEKHRDKFPLETNFGPKVLDDIVLQSTKSAQELAEDKIKAENPNLNGETESKTNVVNDVNTNEIPDGIKDNKSTMNGVEGNNVEQNHVNQVAAAAKYKEIGMEEELTKEENDENVQKENDLESAPESDMSIEEDITKEIYDEIVKAENNLDSAEIADDHSLVENGYEAGDDESTVQDDDVIDEVLKKSDDGVKVDEDKIFNDILDDSDAHTDANGIDENKR